MLVDAHLPGMSRIEVFRVVRKHYIKVEVAVVSALNEVDVAAHAMKNRACHYITNEFNYDGFRSLRRNTIQR